jgi:outer membrane protein assembly factor BamD
MTRPMVQTAQDIGSDEFSMKQVSFRLGAATRISAALLGLGGLLGLSGCSALDSVGNPFSSFFGGEKYETKILPDVPADTIYDQGLARLQKRDYEAAEKKFGELEKSYPYSGWGAKSLLMQTFSEYQAGKYDDAVGTANRYIGLYPTSADTPYIYYLAGMSYYNQIPDVSRDQDRADKAVSIFSALVQKYPTSEYATDAKYKIQVAKDQLAGREMTVGRYYLEKSNYTAAINRFREVLAKYQSTRHTEEALYRLVESYLRLGIPHEAQTAAAVLGHNFPNSQWYQDAFNRLRTDGLEPKENSESWISKAFRKIGVG